MFNISHIQTTLNLEGVKACMELHLSNICVYVYIYI